VRFLGALPQAEVIRVVRGAALFAAPCVVGSDGNADGLPTVLLESMALGTPCVSTDVTGIPEVIRHEATGLLVGQGDATGLATAMSRLLGDAVLRERLAANARGLIAREFDIAANAALQWGVFERAAAWRGRSAVTSSLDPAGGVGLGAGNGVLAMEEELAV
jgi:glycosyltransferase involved in cell wall biosynthesis